MECARNMAGNPFMELANVGKERIGHARLDVGDVHLAHRLARFLDELLKRHGRLKLPSPWRYTYCGYKRARRFSMDNSRERISRADVLKGIIVLPALAATFADLTREAQAAKSSKAAVKYQNHPKGSQRCGGCRFFIKGKTANANGACQIVSGSISPSGWCVAWAKK